MNNMMMSVFQLQLLILNGQNHSNSFPSTRFDLASAKRRQASPRLAKPSTRGAGAWPWPHRVQLGSREIPLRRPAPKCTPHPTHPNSLRKNAAHAKS